MVKIPEIMEVPPTETVGKVPPTETVEQPQLDETSESVLFLVDKIQQALEAGDVVSAKKAHLMLGLLLQHSGDSIDLEVRDAAIDAYCDAEIDFAKAHVHRCDVSL